jgi:hypothetical protein
MDDGGYEYKVKSDRSSHLRYSPEIRERAVRMVLHLRKETDERHGHVKRVLGSLTLVSSRCGAG